MGSDGKLHLVAFQLVKFKLAELNYNIYDKEVLAIVRALKEQKVYLKGAKYQVYVITNYKNLIYFTTTKELTRR